MKQPIIGFHQDDEGDWIADLRCGHTQHVRHDPPWQNRAWVTTAAGREAFLGAALRCKDCGSAKIILPAHQSATPAVS